MKVAIVGGSPSTWQQAPYEDDSWEIWVLGNQLQRYQGRRVSRVFEIHDDLSEHNERYPQWLVSQNLPLVVGPQFPIEGLELYPEQEANEILGGEYLSSSPAYMMAYAILKGAQEIAIYGVDMAVDDHEYFKQRPEMYAFIAYAKARGIKVTIPDQSPLFKGGYVEGRDWGKGVDGGSKPFTEYEFTLMAEQHGAQIEQAEAEIHNLKMKINAHAGAKQAYERMAKVARAIEAGAKIESLADSAVVK